MPKPFVELHPKQREPERGTLLPKVPRDVTVQAVETTMFGGARFVPGTRFVARDRVGRAVPAILKGRVSYNPNTHGFQPLGQLNRKRTLLQTRPFSAYTAKSSCIWCGSWPLASGSARCACSSQPQAVCFGQQAGRHDAPRRAEGELPGCSRRAAPAEPPGPSAAPDSRAEAESTKHAAF